THHKRKDNSLYPVEVHLQFITDNNEKRFLAIILDITERKKSESKILQANERFEKVTEATNDAIWDFDVANNTLFWGKGFQSLFGYDLEITQPSFEFLVSRIHPDDAEWVSNKMNLYMQDPNLKNWHEEYRFIKADGGIAFVIDRATFLRNSKGKVTRVIGAMTDISEQKNHEAQLIALNESLQAYAKELERSNEELEQFAFITSHDLQEPLRMISSFMDQLKRKYEDQLDDKAIKYIDFATDGAKRMKQIILDLLEYSRAGRPTDLIEEVDINEIIADFKLLRSKIIDEKSVSITSHTIPMVKTYKTGITQVFHSLLDNAIKYSKKDNPPKIAITVKEATDKWIFAIKDNGIGIDEKFFNKIFIIFQRLHNREEYEGTGIGLSIVKRHIDFLGGKIWLESELGVGTTFFFELPKTNHQNPLVN
ncbi:MAG: ATP-binding protein, partial [Spirosomataceae bacterium]